MPVMQRGEHYMCDCGAELEVLRPCTCDPRQETLTCICGRPMRAKAGSASG